MNRLSDNYIKLILGLKLKQLRIDKGLSLSELARESGLSVSYLNEIESGKKYPKANKIASLSKALGITYDNLVSLKLTKNLAPIGELLESNLLELLPLDHYGIDINKLITLMSGASMQLSALVTTIIEMARGSEMSQNNFSRTALKTYKEFHENFCDEIEKDVEKFIAKYKLEINPPVSYSALKQFLKENFSYKIDETELKNRPALSGLRGILISKQNKTLLVNPQLTETQKGFVLGKEIAYNIWGTVERSNIHSNFSLESFDHLLNNFRASYFANAILINRFLLASDLEKFFSLDKWEPKELLSIIDKYQATPEMFFQRVTNLLSKHFGIKKFFFLRFNTQLDNRQFYLSKEIRLNINDNPGGYQTDEHYCRRWISIKSLKNLMMKIDKNDKYQKLQVDILHSTFAGSNEEYLSISIAKRRRLNSRELYSVTIGFLLDDNLKSKVRFWDDPSIKRAIVSDTCEMCSIKNCKERVAPPSSLERKIQVEKVKSELARLIKDYE